MCFASFIFYYLCCPVYKVAHWLNHFTKQPEYLLMDSCYRQDEAGRHICWLSIQWWCLRTLREYQARAQKSSKHNSTCLWPFLLVLLWRQLNVDFASNTCDMFYGRGKWLPGRGLLGSGFGDHGSVFWVLSCLKHCLLLKFPQKPCM